MTSPFRIVGAGILFGIICSISLTIVEAGLYWPDYKGNTGATSVDGSIMSLYSSILLDTGVSTDGKVKNTQKLNSLPLASYQRRVSGTCTSVSPLVQVNANGTVTCRAKPSWQPSGTWGACSVSCGGGTQIQPYVCMDASSNVLPDTDCIGAKPANLSRACNTHVCQVNGMCRSGIMFAPNEVNTCIAGTPKNLSWGIAHSVNLIQVSWDCEGSNGGSTDHCNGDTTF